MKVEAKVVKEVNMNLDADEAEWLKAIMQNPFDEQESHEDMVMRCKFFSALRAALA